ncbi:cellulose biosynthesis protein BcsP [Burkholderia diffusa]|uniref:cellulose biosynthesis protein BcsP n=1 Tax=Burkholderia diffusa TaxID=488732 RepID=UPI002ABD6141|nr:cellulose biosynthesis protein BcsP [Burkholderia diffusa]
MSTSRDIESLFKRFGGDAGRYQEVRAEADAEAARARWPLLGGVELRANEPHGQRGQRPPDNAQGLRNIEMTDMRAVSAPDADRRDQPPGSLKKLVGRRAAPDGTGVQGPSAPLVRLFERLRTEAAGEGPTKPSPWMGRS